MYPFWNKNEDDNQVCRLCEHFQRRENEDERNCQGECRKEPLEWSASVKNLTKDSEGEVDAAFAFVPFGNTTWCSGFQISLEADIPAMVEGREACAEQGWDSWLTPWDNMISPAPRLNKKTMLETCWYCEHFQTQVEDNPSGSPCVGFCFIDPPRNYVNENYHTGEGINQIGFDYINPRIQNGAYMWCSKWERSRDVVPDPPEFAGVPCQGGA